jgi:hypothetical protein
MFQIIVLPYWSAFTHAYEKNDMEWIKKIIKKLLLIWCGICLCLLAIYFFNGTIFRLWIKNKIAVNQTTGLWFVLYFASYSGMLPFVTFINGTGKITLQLYIACFVILANIPLTIYFTRNLNMDINGTILAGILCTVPFIILMAIQTVKIINKSPKLIWNA